MDPRVGRRVAEELRKLVEQGQSDDFWQDLAAITAWWHKASALLQAVPGVASDTAMTFESAEGGPVATALLEAAIFQIELAVSLNEAMADSSLTAVSPGAAASCGPIFVVHGRDGHHKHELMRLLDRAIDLPALVLHEQANKGATILEKFEHHAQSASFAVVLLTGDDEGRLRVPGKQPLVPRGRQNVIFELGVFIGLLGREHVVVLKDPEIEEPSDLSGLVYIALDDAGAWRTELLKELAAAGVSVDHSRMP